MSSLSALRACGRVCRDTVHSISGTSLLLHAGGGWEGGGRKKEEEGKRKGRGKNGLGEDGGREGMEKRIKRGKRKRKEGRKKEKGKSAIGWNKTKQNR